MTKNDLLTRHEAAEILGVTYNTLTRWAMEEKHIPVVKIGTRAVRYHRKDLEDYIQRQKSFIPSNENTTR
ncbi:MAG: helix-turn-helix domain-containing protein [Planctomycetaceae bacterium]|nr:helix-turn-helix domain-containing protein [Planctomycetaceae bacterium]